MSGQNLIALITRARQLPPHVALRKAVRYSWRSVVRAAGVYRDRCRSTYGSSAVSRLQLTIALPASDIGQESGQVIAAFCEHYLRHEFDLLGSDWTVAEHGAEMRGIESVRYSPGPDARIVALTNCPTVLVNRANRCRARAIYKMVDNPGYRPIDWQRDLRSGYRWSERQPAREVAIGRHPGADIKLPWELSRLQHLPQLALAALLARSGRAGLRRPPTYLTEIRNQCLDFIASNPPRYGATWACPMDVAIRAANLVLTRGLLAGAAIRFDDAFEQVLADSVHDHAEFVAGNLEWSDSGRSNHYLSDIVGLMFCAAALGEGTESANWAAYAAGALLRECELQFLPDGGNYEGSTSYHCLSAELLAYGIALVAGLAAVSPSLLQRADSAIVTAMPGPPPSIDDYSAALWAITGRLRAILEFTKALRRPDGRILQIGDTDSGRLFKLTPLIDPALSAPATTEGDDISLGWRESVLVPHEVIEALEALLDDPASTSAPATIVHALKKESSLGTAEPSFELCRIEAAAGIEPRLRAERAKAEFPGAWREQHWELQGLSPDAVQMQAFPHFGLYLLKAPRLYLSLRCGSISEGAPSGHFHDDNLAIELHIDDEPLISDPGTYVYTPFPALRNAYREHGAHHAPRAQAWSAVAFTDYLFELKPLARAACLHASPRGIVARLDSPAGMVERIISVEPSLLRIVDVCDRGPLRPLSESLQYCVGYGRKSSRPAFAV